METVVGRSRIRRDVEPSSRAVHATAGLRRRICRNHSRRNSRAAAGIENRRVPVAIMELAGGKLWFAFCILTFDLAHQHGLPHEHGDGAGLLGFPRCVLRWTLFGLSLIHISEPTRLGMIS